MTEAIAPGSRLGPYEILAPLGAGGMGEVWRAKDPRLDREVAIKVLPPEVAGDASRLKRFEKEARAASGLNHPNIVTIYEIGTSDAVSYIAMERVEGKTLRELLFGGAIPIKRLLAIAAQIADGLARAHEAGIVHRDLKPENLMVTRDGLVKILDFGLAKQTAVGSGSDEGSHIPTETGTSPGMVLGTVGYMSPEQAAGQPVDFRSDQFALGSILYEMATGKRAFQKGTAVDTLSAILHEEPKPVAEINPLAPAPLRWIVERCLAKDPDGRYISTRDLGRDLAGLRDRLSEASRPDSSNPAAFHRKYGLRLAVTSLAILAALGIGFLAARGVWFPQLPAPTFHRLTFRNGVVSQARFAPDERTIVYSARWGTDPLAIFTTRSEGLGSRALGPPGAELLSVSSGGELLILRDGTLARSALAGGAEREILESVQDASWAPNGTDIALVRHDAKAKARYLLEFPVGTVLVESNVAPSFPRVSPRADLVAFIEHPLGADSRGWLAVVDRAGKKRRLSEEFNSIQGAQWAAGGQEIWFSGTRAGTSMAIYAVTLSGTERVVARGPGDQELQDVSADGRVLMSHWHGRNMLMARVAGEPTHRDLSWLDTSQGADLSDDGKTLLMTEQGEGAGSLSYSVWLRKTDGSDGVLLGNGLACGLSPDGKWALAVRLQPPPAQLVLLPTGAGEEKVITHDTITHRMAAWFPDGKRVVFLGLETGKGPRLYVQSLEGGDPKPISPELGLNFWVRRPVSPDGRRVIARDGERFFLFPVDGGDPVPVAGLVGRETPIRWSADGRFLYVRGAPGPPIRLSLLDPVTGLREPWEEIPELRGQVLLSADGHSHAISSQMENSDLYLVEGLR